MPTQPKSNWDKFPHTDEWAVPMEDATVQNAHVIWIEEATIREATIRDKHFEIYGNSVPGEIYKGRPTVQVVCNWYGSQLEKTGMHLTLVGRYEEKHGYLGPVVRNIRRPDRRHSRDYKEGDGADNASVSG